MDYKSNIFGKESILPDDIIMSIKTEPIGEPEVIIEQEESGNFYTIILILVFIFEEYLVNIGKYKLFS